MIDGKSDTLTVAQIAALNQPLAVLVERVAAVMPIRVTKVPPEFGPPSDDYTIDVDTRPVDAREYQKAHGLDCVVRVDATAAGAYGCPGQKGWHRFNVLNGNCNGFSRFVAKLAAEKVIR